MTITKALAIGRSELAQSSSAEIDSRFLLCHVLSCQLSYLFTWPEQQLSESQIEYYLDCLVQRKQGQPVAYITGRRSFWTFDLEVSAATLIPRPETELLVTAALEKIEAGMTIADLGTGSGAVALALALERSDITVYASDRSSCALSVAAVNSRRLTGGNVKFWQGEWLAAIRPQSLDMIVTNPPYIEAKDPHLQQGDLRFEPETALISGPSGLEDIERIIEQATQALKPKGWLIIEHGYQQAKTIRQTMAALRFVKIETSKDINDHERVTLGQRD